MDSSGLAHVCLANPRTRGQFDTEIAHLGVVGIQAAIRNGCPRSRIVERPQFRQRSSTLVSVEMAALTGATRVVVVAGASYDAKHRKSNIMFGETDDPEAISTLAELLVDRTSKGMAWTAWPALTVTFLRGREPIAEFPLLDGATWVHDPVDLYCELADPKAVATALAALGVITYPK